MPSYIPLFEDVFANKKVLRAAGELTAGDVEKMVGHLARLWTWALSHTDQGELGHLSAVQIAKAANWPVRTSAKFVEVLVRVRLLNQADRVVTGVRETPDNDVSQGAVGSLSLQIHDWDEYVGSLLIRRLKDRERKRQKRESERKEAGLPAASAGPSADRLPLFRGTAESVSAGQSAERPGVAKPNQAERSETYPPTPLRPQGDRTVELRSGRAEARPPCQRPGCGHAWVAHRGPGDPRFSGARECVAPDCLCGAYQPYPLLGQERVDEAPQPDAVVESPQPDGEPEIPDEAPLSSDPDSPYARVRGDE
jgi:hypothetical protein